MPGYMVGRNVENRIRGCLERGRQGEQPWECGMWTGQVRGSHQESFPKKVSIYLQWLCKFQGRRAQRDVLKEASGARQRILARKWSKGTWS